MIKGLKEERAGMPFLATIRPIIKSELETESVPVKT